MKRPVATLAALLALTTPAIAQIPEPHPLGYLQETRQAWYTEDGALIAPDPGYALVLGEQYCIAAASAWPEYEGNGAWITPYEHGPDWQGFGRASCQWEQVEYFSEADLEAAGIAWEPIAHIDY